MKNLSGPNHYASVSELLGCLSWGAPMVLMSQTVGLQAHANT